MEFTSFSLNFVGFLILSLCLLDNVIIWSETAKKVRLSDEHLSIFSVLVLALEFHGKDTTLK